MLRQLILLISRSPKYDKIMKDLECPTVAAVKARWVRLHTLCTEMYAKGEKFDAGTTKAKATPKKRIIDPSTDTLEVPPTPTKKVRTKKAKAKAKNIEEVEAAAAEETNVAVEE